jgi:anti-sigma28 factor (negative regulator of flagellin synthesis)
LTRVPIARDVKAKRADEVLAQLEDAATMDLVDTYEETADLVEMEQKVRVEALREQVKNGTYTPNFHRVAERMMASLIRAR